MTPSSTPSMTRWGSLRRSVSRTLRWPALALTLAAASQLHAEPPELKTQGNQIVVKATGERVRLVGVNFTGLEQDAGYDRSFLNSLDVLSGTWKGNIIRLAVSDSLWFQSNATAQAAYRSKVDGIITRAGELNIYVILDLHKYKQPKPAATTFWTDAANTYKTKKHVLFGLLNEPHSISWPVWRDGNADGPGMQDLLETVRAQGADNIVLVGGLDYAYDLRGIMPGYDNLPNGYALTDTATGNGVVYDSHVYPWKDYIQLRTGNASLYYPFLLGEFGHPSGTTATGQPDSFEAYPTWMPRMMDWINTNNFHWVGWNFSDGSDPAMLSDWSYTPSPHLGAHALSHMQSYADPAALRVVGGTVIGTPGTRLNPTSGVLTDDRSGAVAPFSNTYAYFFDGPSASASWTGLDLGTAQRITQIKYMPAKKTGGGALMVGGVFEGSNSATFSTADTLYTITTAPYDVFVGNTGTYTTAPVVNANTYRYVRYRGPVNSYSNVAAIRFYTGDDSGPGVNDDVIIVDNGGAGSTVTGTWKNANDYGFHGSRWVSDDNSDKGAKSILYTPVIMKSGLYEVFTIWSAHATSRSDAVPYTITYAGGSTTIPKNQRVNGGSWQSLGTYEFNAGTSGTVLVSNAGTTNYVTADAVKFVYRPAVDLVYDKAVADTTGITATTGWVSSTGAAGYFGDRFFHDNNSGKGAKSVQFTPTITSPGQYAVSVWWTAHSNRANNTPITVNHAAGSVPLTVNQKLTGGQWYPLGTYTFAAGTNPTTGSVLISNTGTTEFVVVDAVRFLRVGN